MILVPESSTTPDDDEDDDDDDEVVCRGRMSFSIFFRGFELLG